MAEAHNWPISAGQLRCRRVRVACSRGARERIQELADQVMVLRDAYYRGSPLVADAEYDAIEDELRGLIAAHPHWAPDPNPLEQVGAPSVLHAPIRHSRPMLSLEKATKPAQVEAFFGRFPGQPLVVMPKLDGLSLALVYESGRLARAITRGDATTGDDVTVLVRALTDGIPNRVDAPGRVEVRGEAVMPRSTFTTYNTAHPDKPLINPRNAAAGTLRAKDPAGVAERRLRFFAFDLDTSDGGAEADLEAGLRTLGFTVADMRHCDDAAAAQAAGPAQRDGREPPHNPPDQCRSFGWRPRRASLVIAPRREGRSRGVAVKRRVLALRVQFTTV